MKTIFTIGLLLTGFTWASLAQGDKEYQAWMKTAGGAVGVLKKAIDAKAGADAAEAAKKLEGVFTHVEAFWKERKVDDAVKYAHDARAAATDIASTAASGGDASAAFAKLGASCKGCHEMHREKAADGSFKIK